MRVENATLISYSYHRSILTVHLRNSPPNLSRSDPHCDGSSTDICVGKRNNPSLQTILNMRKLKLQVQMSLDGFVAGPNGELEWIWLLERDEASFRKVIDLADSCDTILLGRKMTPGFINHWENVVDNQPDSIEQPLAQRMVNMRKIVFSRTEKNMKGRNLEVESGDLATAVHALKKQPGKDIMVYGGATFASSLISQNLVDEYYIFRTPVAIGNGLSIFKEQKRLDLANTVNYKNGKVLEIYRPL
jgi:dihydrofolate reductase